MLSHFAAEEIPKNLSFHHSVTDPPLVQHQFLQWLANGKWKFITISLNNLQPNFAVCKLSEFKAIRATENHHQAHQTPTTRSCAKNADQEINPASHHERKLVVNLALHGIDCIFSFFASYIIFSLGENQRSAT